MQALAEQKVQLEAGMANYGLEVQQASLTVLAWQAHMAALHASPRSGPFQGWLLQIEPSGNKRNKVCVVEQCH